MEFLVKNGPLARDERAAGCEPSPPQTHDFPAVTRNLKILVTVGAQSAPCALALAPR